MVIEGLSKPGDRWRIKSLRIWVTRSPPVPMEHFNRLLRKLLPEKSDFPSGKLSKCQIFGHIADIIDKHYRGLTDQQVANAVETGEWPDLRPAKNENQIQEEDDGHTAPPLPPTVPPNVPPTVPPAIPAAVPPTVPTTITADVTTININSARTYLNITGPFQFSEVEGQSTSREKSSGDKLSDSKEAPQDPKDPAGGEGVSAGKAASLFSNIYLSRTGANE